MDEKINLMGLSHSAMKEYFSLLGESSFRATQVFKWIYQKKVSDISQMTNLSKSLRNVLLEKTKITLPDITYDHLSEDGTRKWLLQVPGKSAIEMVFIPESSRGTLCVSSQVGCTLDCVFCATGKQGFNRDLTSAEIISQVWLAEKILSEYYQTDDRVVSNVVMMGMGEPLLNFDNVCEAMSLMLDDNGFGLSKRRVTLSTAGVVPKIDQLKERCPVSLAVSLHAPNNELRNKLVPLNKKYPIEVLIEACQRYVKDSHRARITFEYIMLDNINDSLEHAKQLADWVKKVPSKVNLIPFNSFKGIDFTRPSNNKIHRFRDYLASHDIVTTIRRTRGDDIEAACGQLAGDVLDRTRRSEKHQMKQLKAKALSL